MPLMLLFSKSLRLWNCSNKNMKIRLVLPIVLVALLCFSVIESKTIDPYKVLGIDKSASQRDIQKAFHKLSLKYHPDKNKSKGAQEKFSELNNAYEILSDEEKRKNYDMYGDEKGNPGFDVGGPGGQGGYSYFRSDGSNFESDGWQTMDDHGGSRSFSFSFGGPGAARSSGFGLEDIFSGFFGGSMNSGGHFGGLFGSSRSQPGSGSSGSFSKNIRSVDSQVYRNEITDKGMTWLLLSYKPSMKVIQQYESVIEQATSSLEGALKFGRINCASESSLCKELGILPRKQPGVFIYSYKASPSGSLVEYSGDLAVRSLKTFCQDQLPRFSKRVDMNNFDISSATKGNLPQVMLLSSKKDTPVIWRVLSGMYNKRFIFYDAEVHDVSDPMLRKLGVDALPAVVGWLPNGEKHILRTGISTKDLKSGVHDLSILLDGFEKTYKKAASNRWKKEDNVSEYEDIPILTTSNFNDVCGEKSPVCIIGAFKSHKARDKMEAILSSVSKKSLSRRWHSASNSKDAVSYSLLDATKQPAFLNSFYKSGFKSADKVLLAYKPKKDKFAAFVGEFTSEEVEVFISSVFNGDLQFKAVRSKPTLK